MQSQCFLDGCLQIGHVRRLLESRSLRQQALGLLVRNLLAEFLERPRILEKIVERSRETNGSGVGPGTDVHAGAGEDVVRGEPLRVLLVPPEELGHHGLHGALVLGHGLDALGVVAELVDPALRELVDVVEARLLAAGQQTLELEEVGVQTRVDPDRGGVVEEVVEGGHNAADIAAAVEETEALAKGDVANDIKRVALKPVAIVDGHAGTGDFCQSLLKDVGALIHVGLK